MRPQQKAPVTAWWGGGGGVRRAKPQRPPAGPAQRPRASAHQPAAMRCGKTPTTRRQQDTHTSFASASASSPTGRGPSAPPATGRCPPPPPAPCTARRPQPATVEPNTTGPKKKNKTYRLHHLGVKGVGGDVDRLGRRRRHGHPSRPYPPGGTMGDSGGGGYHPLGTHRRRGGRPRARRRGRGGGHKGGHADNGDRGERVGKGGVYRVSTKQATGAGGSGGGESDTQGERRLSREGTGR